MNYWIITVANPWCDSILNGWKTMEVRKTVPSDLHYGDVIFIARKGGHGRIVGAFLVVSILSAPVSSFCVHWYSEHRLTSNVLHDYAGSYSSLVGIGLDRMKLDTWALTVRSFGLERSPQWFYRIRPEYKSTIERVLI